MLDIRKMSQKLLQFGLGFLGSMFLLFLHSTVVQGQNNLPSSDIIPEEYREYYIIIPRLGAWLNDAADQYPILTFTLLLLLINIIIFVSFQRLMIQLQKTIRIL
ncbi:MAG: hypothetical protein QNJ37_06735 [Crocosphaera sp.]|nr:hypothetical protein [Crocosphaera sp.]